jgi:hypothetical protein
MRIMMLNHQSKREGGRDYEERVAALLRSYASPGTTLEFHYPEDLGGTEITSQLRKGQALAGLHHALETPALVKKIIEAERKGFDAVVQTNNFDPAIEVARCAVRIPVIGVLRVACRYISKSITKDTAGLDERIRTSCASCPSWLMAVCIKGHRLA